MDQDSLPMNEPSLTCEPSKSSIADAPAQASMDAAACEQEAQAHGNSRRDFLHRSVRKLVYVPPVVMLFHPKPACASSGSQLSSVIEAPSSAKDMSKRLGRNVSDRLDKTATPQSTIPQTVIQQKLRPPGPGGL